MRCIGTAKLLWWQCRQPKSPNSGLPSMLSLKTDRQAASHGESKLDQSRNGLSPSGRLDQASSECFPSPELALRINKTSLWGLMRD
jgi:hypothetical protein